MPNACVVYELLRGFFCGLCRGVRVGRQVLDLRKEGRPRGGEGKTYRRVCLVSIRDNAVPLPATTDRGIFYEKSHAGARTQSRKTSAPSATQGKKIRRKICRKTHPIKPKSTPRLSHDIRHSATALTVLCLSGRVARARVDVYIRRSNYPSKFSVPIPVDTELAVAVDAQPVDVASPRKTNLTWHKPRARRACSSSPRTISAPIISQSASHFACSTTQEVFSAQAARSASCCTRSASGAIRRTRSSNPANLPSVFSFSTPASAPFPTQPQLPVPAPYPKLTSRLLCERAPQVRRIVLRSGERRLGGAENRVEREELDAQSVVGSTICRAWILRVERVGGGGEGSRQVDAASSAEGRVLATASLPCEDMRMECSTGYRVGESGGALAQAVRRAAAAGARGRLLRRRQAPHLGVFTGKLAPLGWLGIGRGVRRDRRKIPRAVYIGSVRRIRPRTWRLLWTMRVRGSVGYAEGIHQAIGGRTAGCKVRATRDV
ncbi:hypothetical protein C8J57DRAFT_1480517 [Mycena rebaudengoi]|nr:hypothetical protein C8J57DRAFT_1480517 [Mycena rebaudengoi]